MNTDARLCQGKDVLERMNFLYQASRLMVSKDDILASYYGKVMVSCARKAVLRIEPDMKRSICKGCHSPLIPGKTVKVRLKSKPTKAITWTCLICNTTRKLPNKGDYKLWVEQPDAVIEMLDYSHETVTSASPVNTSGKKHKKECHKDVSNKTKDTSHNDHNVQVMEQGENHDNHKVLQNTVKGSA
ncbi:ribonuclease P protein subunit rpr2 [Orussus abietinus]|uniref:ribonuclease P protein subunit rpr2 n=1 Tax=Orussus abietinus TaxID=222816 RepID=UPI000626E066|nr:ribonuclease P protein subunit rpr2 [Orussus abietinus]